MDLWSKKEFERLLYVRVVFSILQLTLCTRLAETACGAATDRTNYGKLFPCMHLIRALVFFIYVQQHTGSSLKRVHGHQETTEDEVPNMPRDIAFLLLPRAC